MSRVLMVDNAALFRMLDASFLRRAGWEIAVARTCDDLIERAPRLEPDLILLDSGSGFDAAGCVRGLKADATLRAIPVLVLADAAEAAACEAAGADAILVRPAVTETVEAALCALARVAPRGGRRRPTRLPARVSTPDGAVRGRLRDISATGAFLSLPRPVAAGTALGLHLRLPLPEGGREVEARAIVVRAVGDDPASDRVTGVGVRFTGVGAGAAAIIDRYVGLEVDGDDGAGEAPDDGLSTT